MRIETRFGCDTGMCFADVLLDIPEELSYTDEQLECIAWDMLREQQIDRREVVDLFIRVRNGRGEWVHATRDADGKLVPVSWS